MSDAAGGDWDHSVDLLIVGSGAGAMTAALVAHDRGAETLLIEKSDRYGGSSAMSGGGLWIPNNCLMAGVGIDDSPEEAWTYLKGTVGDVVPEDRLRAFMETSPKMLEYMLEHTHTRFVSLPEYADYYPRVPGAKPGGRSLEPQSFYARALGRDFLRLRDQNPQMLIMGTVFMTIFEARKMLTRAPGWIALMLRLAGRYLFDLPWRLHSRRDRHLAMGNALVARLRRSVLDRRIPLRLETAARELVALDGRVVGVVAERQGRTVRIRARRGVVLAAGGFEHSQVLRDKYLPHPTRSEWSCANTHNTGDAIQMGQAVGAALELMDDAWWGPTTVVPGETHARMLVIEKSLPGSILVDRSGRRFVNEAAPYIDVVNAMYGKGGDGELHLPTYLIFDATYRKNYPCGPLFPGAQWPDWMLPRRFKSGYLAKAQSLDELARMLDIDAAGLREQVETVNRYARSGKDLDFERGETSFDRYYGDEKVEPNACLAPIETPPFYGLEAFPGELGTKGGLCTDARARVLRESGEPIPGLYAIGNCSASVMGHSYPGAGSTLAPAMTFGFIAARDAVPD
ncbi:MAG: FAD-binding protein [Myxococcota bacterium]